MKRGKPVISKVPLSGCLYRRASSNNIAKDEVPLEFYFANN